MPEISTGCLLSAMFVDIIRASIHDRDSAVGNARSRLHGVPILLKYGIVDSSLTCLWINTGTS